MQRWKAHLRAIPYSVEYLAFSPWRLPEFVYLPANQPGSVPTLPQGCCDGWNIYKECGGADIGIDECVEAVCYGDTVVAKSETSEQAAAKFLRGPHLLQIDQVGEKIVVGNSDGLVLLQNPHAARAQADRDRSVFNAKFDAITVEPETQVRISA